MAHLPITANICFQCFVQLWSECRSSEVAVELTHMKILLNRWHSITQIQQAIIARAVNKKTKIIILTNEDRNELCTNWWKVIHNYVSYAKWKLSEFIDLLARVHRGRKVLKIIGWVKSKWLDTIAGREIISRACRGQRSREIIYS